MADTEKQPKHRSPAYPFIPLRKAVERAAQLHERNKRHPAPMAVAAGLWGYKEKSSGGLQTVSALKQYGLLADVGTGAGKSRQVQLTTLALSILLDEVPNSPERSQAVKRAALAPKLFREMFDKWGLPLPADETIRTYLKRDKMFNDDAVGGVIKDFKDTLEYANLSDSDKISDADKDDSPSGGAKVQEIQPLQPKPPSHGQPSVGVAREVFSLENGEAVLQWPLSLNADGVQELEDWLTLVIKKLKRLKAKQTSD